VPDTSTSLADRVRRGFAASKALKLRLGNVPWAQACANKYIELDSQVHQGEHYRIKLETAALNIARHGGRRIESLHGDYDHFRTLVPKEVALWWVTQIQDDEEALENELERYSQARRDAMAREAEERRDAYERRYKAEAEVVERAENTLRSHLTEAQWQCYVQLGCVPVRSVNVPSRVYVFTGVTSQYYYPTWRGPESDPLTADREFAMNTTALQVAVNAVRSRKDHHINTYIYERDIQVDQVCIQTSGKVTELPIADQILSLILLLWADEATFLSTGNRYYHTDYLQRRALQLLREE